MRKTRVVWYVAAFCLLSGPTALADAKCDNSFDELLREVAPGVVQVYSVSIDPFTIVHRVQHAVGTGFVVDDLGHIITNAHLVYGASVLMVATAGDDMLAAEVIGIDPISDLAVVKLSEPGEQLQKISLGESGNLSIGAEVLAVGYPFGIGKTATRGIISGMERIMPFYTSSWMTPLIQTDAAISPGNSGGPLVDRCGTVVAVNTIGSTMGQNVNFSIPIDTVKKYLPQLIEHGRVIRAWHGINGVIVPMPVAFSFGIPPGYAIETIEPGSPAEELGLRGGSFPIVLGNNEFLIGGDVIAAVNDEPLTDMETVYRIATSLKVGDTIKLSYYRDGILHEAEVVLPERPVLPGDVKRFRENSHRQ
jgi:S1-C subfamily serine protease